MAASGKTTFEFSNISLQHILLDQKKATQVHCVKNVCSQSFSGPYFPAFRLILLFEREGMV